MVKGVLESLMCLKYYRTMLFMGKSKCLLAIKISLFCLLFCNKSFDEGYIIIWGGGGGSFNLVHIKNNLL